MEFLDDEIVDNLTIILNCCHDIYHKVHDQLKLKSRTTKTKRRQNQDEKTNQFCQLTKTSLKETISNFFSNKDHEHKLGMCPVSRRFS